MEIPITAASRCKSVCWDLSPVCSLPPSAGTCISTNMWSRLSGRCVGVFTLLLREQKQLRFAHAAGVHSTVFKRSSILGCSRRAGGGQGPAGLSGGERGNSPVQEQGPPRQQKASRDAQMRKRSPGSHALGSFPSTDTPNRTQLPRCADTDGEIRVDSVTHQQARARCSARAEEESDE